MKINVIRSLTKHSYGTSTVHEPRVRIVDEFCKKKTKKKILNFKDFWIVLQK